MSPLAAWLVYCGAVSAVLFAAALAWESSARWSGRGARWGWLAALAGSVSLPWLLRLVPRQAWPEPVAMALPQLPMTPSAFPAPPPLDVAATAGGLAAAPAALGWGAMELALVGWVLLTVAAVTFVVRASLRLNRAMRRWDEAELEGGRVLVSERVGPAAVGLRRSVVVIPSWVLRLGDDARSLLLAHEREHVRAGDPRLLFTGLLCVAAMPWNPLVWWQFQRLRNAIELDCDARVLAAGANPRQYGRLLLEVGQRRSAGGLVMATFSEPRAYLEERIRRIAGWPLQRRPRRAAGFAVVAVLLCATALSARNPLAPVALPGDIVSAPPAANATVAETTPSTMDPRSPTRDGEDGPVIVVHMAPLAADTPALANRSELERALARAYPESVRAAGTGGVVLVLAFVTPAGTVQRMQLGTSSGHAELDKAALEVVANARFAPQDGRADGAWVELPLAFGAVAAMPGTTRSDLIRLPVITAAAVEPDPAERAQQAQERVRAINDMFRDGQTLAAIEAARAALARGDITAEQAETLAQMAAVQGFQMTHGGDLDAANAILTAARGIAASQRSAAMVDFFLGHVLLRQSQALLGEGANAARAQQAQGLLERARRNLEAAEPYHEQQQTRQQLMQQIEQLNQVATALVRRGR